MMGATMSALFSVCFVASILGVISQKIKRKNVVQKVAITVPQLKPNIGIHNPVTIADMAVFTKSFPMTMAAMNLSNFVVKFWMLCALLIPFETIWRSLSLLKAIIEVSETAKKKDNTANIIKIVIMIAPSVFLSY